MINFSVPSGDFKLFIETILALVIETRLHITPTGLSAISVDPANVAMVIASYDIPTGVAEETIIGIEPEKLRKLLNIIESGELNISIENGFIRFKSDQFESEVRLIDIATIRNEPSVPAIELLSTFTDTTKTFPTALKKIMALGGEKILISIADGTVTLKCGEDDKLVRVIKDAEMPGITGTASALYSKDYLTSMEGILKKLHSSTYMMKNDNPIKIMAQNEPATIKVTYLIAPRIENDYPQEAAV